VKFRFIREHAVQYPIVIMTRVLGVSSNGYYVWCRRAPSCRDIKTTAIDSKIISIFKAHKGRCGARKLHRELVSKNDATCGPKKVATRMKVLGLVARKPKKFVMTTDGKHDLPIEPNLLNREFIVTEPNRGWVGDITFIPTKTGWVYLAVVIDLYSRKVVGWSVSTRIDAALVIAAFLRACWLRRPDPGLLFHSDRGSQYASAAFRNVLAAWHCLQSMSRKGNCWDNAVAESFFKTLKVEWLYMLSSMLENKEHVEREIFEYIEVYFHRMRLHETLGYLTPEQFESVKPIWRSQCS
jgi:transposase InsO family protein